jgi:chaperone required for assembly of F1-ATPase
LCHRAGEPPELIVKQGEIWQPLVDWFVMTFRAPLQVTSGIMPITQSDEAVLAASKVLSDMNEFQLAALQQAVALTGSLVLGLALMQRRLSARQTFEAAELDALFQAEKWGEDPAAAARHKDIARELAICEHWLGLLGSV